MLVHQLLYLSELRYPQDPEQRGARSRQQILLTELELFEASLEHRLTMVERKRKQKKEKNSCKTSLERTSSSAPQSEIVGLVLRGYSRGDSGLCKQVHYVYETVSSRDGSRPDYVILYPIVALLVFLLAAVVTSAYLVFH